MISTKLYSADKDTVARYVENQLTSSEPDLQWTMTITPGRSGDYSVTTVIEGSSEDTDESLEAEFFSATQVNT